MDTAAVEVAENIAKAAEPALQAAPQQVEQSYSLIQMAAKGGWLMIVLAILSVIAIYIFGKKWWMIHKAKQVDKNFMRDIRDYIHEGKVKSALSLCEKYDSPVARLVEKGIERIGKQQMFVLRILCPGSKQITQVNAHRIAADLHLSIRKRDLPGLLGPA